MLKEREFHLDSTEDHFLTIVKMIMDLIVKASSLIVSSMD